MPVSGWKDSGFDPTQTNRSVCTPGSTSCLDSTTLRVCNDLHAWNEVVCINSCGDTGGGVDGCLATSTETEPNGDATEALTNNLITIPWDGTNDRQERVPAGVYFVKAVTGKAEGVTKVVIVR